MFIIKNHVVYSFDKGTNVCFTFITLVVCQFSFPTSDPEKNYQEQGSILPASGPDMASV